MDNKMINAEPQGSIVLYTTPDGVTQLDVKLANDTVWLSQQQMAKLFDVEENNISHPKDSQKRRTTQRTNCSKN